MCTLSISAKKEITRLIHNVVDKYLDKAKNSPSSHSGNPFVLALLRDFEPLLHRIHGLKTSLGNEMEKIAEIIAKDSWGAPNVQRKMKINVQLPKNVFQTIDTIINDLSNAKRNSNYQNEKELLISALGNPSSTIEKHTYEFDLELFDKKNNKFYYLEMKGPDPNTTEVPGAKRRLLIAMCWSLLNKKPLDVEGLFAIYYNNQHPKPYSNPKVRYYFDPEGGIIVQENFWNFLGKNKNTYAELLNLFDSYGRKNKKRIWDGFSKLIL